jgi:hypothetical protein
MSLRQVLLTMLGLMLTANLAVAATDKSSQPTPCEAIDSVGRAKMSADGTITLQLRSSWPDPIAETQMVFAPDDPQYADIKRHLGGIASGETKPIPPWCGLNSEP